MKNHTIKFEMTEAQYSIIKEALMSAQAVTRENYVASSERLTNWENEGDDNIDKERMTRTYASSVRSATDAYNKNWETQQTMANQAWASYDEQKN